MPLRTWTLPNRQTRPRLLSLLLILLLVLVTFPTSHAATLTCRNDCSPLQGKMLAQGQTPDMQADCGTACAPPVASLQPAVIPPLARPFMVTVAMNEHVTDPPRRPPRP